MKPPALDPLPLGQKPADPGATAPAPPEVLAGYAALLGSITRAREDFRTFFEFVWHGPRGEPVFVQDFQKGWIEGWDHESRFLVLASRGHGKSDLLLCRILWELGRNTNLRIGLVAQNDAAARKALAALKQHIETNKALHLVFPDLKRDPDAEWSKSAVFVRRSVTNKHASIKAFGILSSDIVGSRFDLVVADDVNDLRNAILHPKLREQTLLKFFGELMPCMDPQTGRVWVAATPWHPVDLAGTIRGMRGWRVVETRVGGGRDLFEPLWPSRFPRAKLRRIHQEIGPIEYDRAYRLKALSRETVPIRPMWIKYYTAADLGDPNDLLCLVIVDPAISQTASADYFAYVVLLYDEQRNLTFVVDAGHDRITFHEQAQKIVSLATTWGASQVIIEAVAYQGALADEVGRIAGRPIPVVPVNPKGVKKERRLIEVTPVFQGGRILFHPKLDPKQNVDVTSTGDLVGELIEFPLGDHDDMLDALVYGLQALREYGPSALGDSSSPDGGTRVTILGEPAEPAELGWLGTSGV